MIAAYSNTVIALESMHMCVRMHTHSWWWKGEGAVHQNAKFTL